MRVFFTSMITLLFFTTCHNTPHLPAAAPVSQTPDSLASEMTEDIRNLVNSGFYDSARLVDDICDMFYKEKIDTPWVRATVSSACRKKLAEQASWPAVTDFDKLAQVFDQLDRQGIVALHNAGNTQDEGEEDAGEIRKDLQAKGIKCRGYCFYDTQDIDRAIAGHELYLAFGQFDGDTTAGRKIGREINALLNRSGFQTVWDQRLESRIGIKPFDWKKRFGNENCSYEHAKELLSKR